MLTVPRPAGDGNGEKSPAGAADQPSPSPEGGTPAAACAPTPAITHTRVAGDHVVAVELEPYSRDLIGVVLPLQLNVKVDGAPSGQPVFATGPTPSASATPSDPPRAPPVDRPVSGTGPSALTLVLAGAGGALVLALATAAAVLVVRRRRSARRPGS